VSDHKKRTLTQAEKRALASAGLVVTRYDAGGERATVPQLSPEGPERRRDFIRRLTRRGEESKANEGSE
jgi:hypothetical protein